MADIRERKAVLTDEVGREITSKVLYFAYLLTPPSLQIVKPDYLNPQRDYRRNQGLHNQLQPAFERLSSDPDYATKIESIRKSMMPGLRMGTCSIELDPDEKRKLIMLLERNGANVTGTRVKKIINSLAF